MRVVRRYGKRTAPPATLDSDGLLFLEIDGLAHDVLLRAIRDGNAPTMARWLREGSHRLARWETDWSSQTGACQAGLLHGDNLDMPAFRWWEKDRGAAIVTNHPRDAAEIERRHSNGRGLLFSDGASRANIVSGDAPHSLLTMSTVLRRDRQGRVGQDYFAYFANPYNVMRTLLLVAREVLSELLERLAPTPPATYSRASAAASAIAGTRLGDDRPARPPGRLDHRRHVRGQAGRLHAPSWPTTRSPTTPASSDPRRSRRCARWTTRSGASRTPRFTRRGPIAWSCSPTTASPREPPSSTATARRWSSSCTRRSRRVRRGRGSPSEALAFLGASLAEASARSSLISNALPRSRTPQRRRRWSHRRRRRPTTTAPDGETRPRRSS